MLRGVKPGLTAAGSASALAWVDGEHSRLDIGKVPNAPGAHNHTVTLNARESGLDVMLDPGHGHPDPGAVAVNGLTEADVVWHIAQTANLILKRLGYRVSLTRTARGRLIHDDWRADLSARARKANEARARIFVSFHCDSYVDVKASGATTFHYPGSFYGKLLAKRIHRAVVATMGFEDRKVRAARFVVLQETVMPAVLLETGFLSNYADFHLLVQSSTQEKIGVAVALAIDGYFALYRGASVPWLCGA